MADCLFCKIAGGEVSAEVVYEDDHAMAFLDIHPKAPGHTVVIPKRHAEILADMPDGEVGPLFTAVKTVAARLAAVFGTKGMTIGINQGKASGQSVDHVHVHLLPRWENDGGGSVHSIVDNPPEEPLPATAEKIRRQTSP